MKTYQRFMKKYKLPLTIVKDNKRKYKTMKQMAKEIYDHETRSDRLIMKGLYYI
jgi:hypothetical protein